MPEVGDTSTLQKVVRMVDAAALSSLAISYRRECSGHGEISLRYRVRGENGLSICRNYVDSEKALLQGAATFISPVKPVEPALEVEVELPPAWESIHTGLPRIPDRGEGHFRASNFDRLVDCPIVAGSPEHEEFRVAGVVFPFAQEAPKGYCFLSLQDGGGGLEHGNSSCDGILSASAVPARWNGRCAGGT